MPAVTPEDRVTESEHELHVSLDLPRASARQIYLWAQNQPWPEGTELEKPGDYHITLLYTPEGHEQFKDAWWLEHMDQAEVKIIGISAFPAQEQSYAYVLRVESEEIQQKADEMQGRAEWAGLPITKFPGGYKPHITVGYGPSSRLTGIDVPNFQFDVGPSSVSPPRLKEGRLAVTDDSEAYGPSPDAGEVHILPSERSGNGRHQVMVIDHGGLSQWPTRYGPGDYGWDNPKAIVTPPEVIDQAHQFAQALDRTRGTRDEPHPNPPEPHPNEYGLIPFYQPGQSALPQAPESRELVQHPDPWMDNEPGTLTLPPHWTHLAFGPSFPRTSEYNGWSNWETWNTKLMMDNERHHYDAMHGIVEKGGGPEELRQHFEPNLIGPYNNERLQEAQDWNAIHPDERRRMIDERDRAEFGDAAVDMGRGIMDAGGLWNDPGKDDTAELIDPHMVNWDEIHHNILSEYDDDHPLNQQYQNPAPLTFPQEWTGQTKRATQPTPQTMYHFAPRAMRESIMQHGLDWTRHPAFAGWTPEEYADVPEGYGVHGNYLSGSLDQARLMQPMQPHDLYEVDTHGLELQPDEAWYQGYSTPQPIPPERLRRIGGVQHRGAQTMYHVAPQSARERIAQQGLLPGSPYERWGESALSDQPNGVYLWRDRATAEYWRDQYLRLIGRRHPELAGPHDIYQVEVDPTAVADDASMGPGSSVVHDAPIPPERLRRIASKAPEPPNYRHHEKAGEKCFTCKMFDHEQKSCWGFGNKQVASEAVCDDFYPEHKRAAYNPNDISGTQILDHLSLTNVAANIHYKFAEGGLDPQAATDYAKRMLKLIGYPPDDITVQAALQAWQQLYPDDRIEGDAQPANNQLNAPTVPTKSWGYGTRSKVAMPLAEPLEPHLTLYHGTTNRALERARQSGALEPWHPRDVAHEVASHYGLDPEEFYHNPYFEFSRGRHEDPNLYMTTDPRVAQSYASSRSEQLTDALHTAHRMLYPEMYGEAAVEGLSGVQGDRRNQLNVAREQFQNQYHQHHDIQPQVVKLNVPYSALGDQATRMVNAGYAPEGSFVLPGPVPLDWVSQVPEKFAHSSGELCYSKSQGFGYIGALTTPQLYHWLDASQIHDWMDESHTGPGQTFLTETGDDPHNNWNPDVPQFDNPVRLTIDPHQLDPNGFDPHYEGWLGNHLYTGAIPQDAITDIKSFKRPDEWDEQFSTVPTQVNDPADHWPEFGQTPPDKKRDIQFSNDFNWHQGAATYSLPASSFHSSGKLMPNVAA